MLAFRKECLFSFLYGASRIARRMKFIELAWLKKNIKIDTQIEMFILFFKYLFFVVGTSNCYNF